MLKIWLLFWGGLSLVKGLWGCTLERGDDIGIIGIHLQRCSPIRHLFLFIFSGGQYRCNIGLPLGPVFIYILGHVFGLLVRVLQKNVRWLLRALMRIPVLWDSPWFSARFHSWSAHNLQRKVHALTLSTFKESIMLHVYLQNVLNLEDLSHPRWTHILVLHLLFI